MGRKLININQAREALGCSRQHVYNLFHKGAIEGFFNGEGRGLRIYLDSVLTYKDDQGAKY